LDEAQKEASKLRSDQASALRNDQARLGKEITRAAQDEVFSIARKTLADLATANLEERVCAVFTHRLGQMDEKAKGTMAAALKSSAEPALLQSAFDLPADQRATIQNALNETFSADVRLRFETAAGKICGIQLSSNGQQIGWSIADYLKSLDEKVHVLLGSQPIPAAAAAPAPKLAIATGAK
jgi:F-type H+-transporting ATPase subunit b